MPSRLLKLAFVAVQAFWMVVVLPAHVRGAIVLGGDGPAPAVCPAESACCREDTDAAEKRQTPSPERQSRCAVCAQAHGYTLPPIYDIDLRPAGLLELCRLIEPTRLHLLLCRPVYFATAPPVVNA